MMGGFGGWAGWLIRKIRKAQATKPHLELLDRIPLAPRQSLALVEAEGCRILVATSAEASPAFYPLGEKSAMSTAGRKSARRASRAATQPSSRTSRVSW
jgi:flagellar biogenesis protein FliO